MCTSVCICDYEYNALSFSHTHTHTSAEHDISPCDCVESAREKVSISSFAYHFGLFILAAIVSKLCRQNVKLKKTTTKRYDKPMMITEKLKKKRNSIFKDMSACVHTFEWVSRNENIATAFVYTNARTSCTNRTHTHRRRVRFCLPFLDSSTAMYLANAVH